MRVARLDEMVKGWFVGGFEPTAYKTDAVEVALKEYDAGAYEERHHHKLATELTLIVNGEVEMNGKRYGAGDIVIVDRNESTDFRALTPVKTVVVKVPGAANDKYMGDAKA
jgi:anti-sigma factor ChrR (cupin superfamily)